MKKHKHIPAKKNAAPAKKAETTQKVVKQEQKKTAEERTIDLHIKRLREQGVSEEKINELLTNENARIILCSAYSNYTLDTKIVVKGKSKKLQGFNAVKFLVNKNKIPILDTGNGYCYILTTKDKVDNIVSILKGTGRIYVRKWSKTTKKQHSEHKPTNNTSEVKKEAKKNRKMNNALKTNMRPFYAAKRAGGVSERIKKYNPKLAEQIEAWLKDYCKGPIGSKRRKKARQFSMAKLNLTNAQKRTLKAIKQDERKAISLNKKKAVEAKRMALNAKIKAEKIAKKKAEKEQPLNMVA